MRPRLTGVVALLVLIAAAAGIPKLTMQLRMYDLLDPSFPSTQTLADMNDQFKDRNSIVLLFSTPDRNQKLTREQLCGISKLAHEERMNQSELDQLLLPLELRVPKEDGKKLWYRTLADLNCDTSEGAVEGHQQADAAPLKRLRDSPWGPLVTDAQGSSIALEYLFRDTLGHSKFGKFDPKPIGPTVEHAEKLGRALGLEVSLVGRLAFDWYFRVMMKRDTWVNVAVLVMILIFCRVFFGTWRSGLFLVSTLIATGAFLYGLMGWLKVPVDFLTTNLFLLLSIAGIEDFLFLSFRQMRSTEVEPSLLIRNSFRELITPSFLTSFTTSIGFASLVISDVALVGRFGIWCAVGAMLEWAVLFLLLPAVCQGLGTQAIWVKKETAWYPKVLTRLESIRPRKMFIWFALLLSIGGAWSFRHLNYDDSPSRNFPSRHPNTVAFKLLKERMGWQGVVRVIFKNAKPDLYSGKRIEKMDAALEEIRRHPNTVAIDNPNDVLEYFSKGLDPPTQAMVRSDFSMTRGFEGAFSRAGDARATLYLRSTDIADLRETQAAVQAACKARDCFVTGESIVFLEVSEGLARTLVASFGISLLIVGATLFSLGSNLPLRTRLSLIYSSLWGPLVSVGLMAVLGVPVGMITCMFPAVLVGLTGDNAVQFVCAAYERKNSLEGGMNDFAGASVLLTIALIMISACLFAMTLLPMKMLGFLFIAGFILGLVGDLWLLRGLLRAGA